MNQSIIDKLETLVNRLEELNHLISLEGATAKSTNNWGLCFLLRIDFSTAPFPIIGTIDAVDEITIS